MNESLRLGRIAGIAIGFNWSLLVIVWLITWSLAVDAFPAAYPGHTTPGYWLAAIITSIAFFACLLAHELGHAVTARRRGVRVEGITLWLFGGVAKLSGEAATPAAELKVALVGPAVSVAAGLAFGAFALVLDPLGAPDLVVAVPVWLARINVILAVFNLVPAYPLDGGRVLQAVLWRRTGDRLGATLTAARAGRTFGYVLIGLGLLQVTAGAAIGGLWFVFLGWFLLLAARAEATGVATRELLSGVLVGDVMSPDPVVVPATMTVGDLLERYALQHRFSAFPVVDEAGELTGLITLGRLKSVPPARRLATPAASVACPLRDVPQARPDEPLLDLLARMASCPDGRALVLQRGRLVGIVSPTDVARTLQVAALRDEAASASGRSAQR
jgi:Zn-dependent protease